MYFTSKTLPCFFKPATIIAFNYFGVFMKIIVHRIKAQSLFWILPPNIECLMHLYNGTKIGGKYFKYFVFRRFETGECL